MTDRPVLTMLITLSMAAFIALSQYVHADTASASNQEIRTFAVENMSCPACPITVRKVMSRVDGVVNIEVDFKTKTATATYDPARATPQDIAAASTDVGFPATLIDTERSGE